MISFKLDDFPEFHDHMWFNYGLIDFGCNSLGYRGFRDYIEKNNTTIKTSGNITKGINLIFDNEQDATMFLLRWS